jgi:hypothetical protein
VKLSKYAFIVKGGGYQPFEHRADLKTADFETRVVGVSNTSSACLVAEGLVQDGIQLIELCGGFTLEEAEKIRGLHQSSHSSRCYPI